MSDEFGPGEGSSSSGADSSVYRIVDDVGGARICCVCGSTIPEDTFQNECLGYLLCSDKCENKYTSEHIGMSSAVDSRDTYLIDGQGLIWEGMPDDPEPCCHLRDLPIFSEHPELSHYHRFPISALSKQLELLDRPGEYKCFVCGNQHVAPEKPRLF